MSDETEVKTHPSFGMLGFSRCQSGGTYLAGSPVRSMEFIKLSLKHSEMHRDLSHDRWFARGQIIEVWLSPAQFATLLTSMNVGDGVPCTIRYADGEDKPMPPQPDCVNAKIQNEFKSDCEKTAKALDAALAMAKAGVTTKKAQAELVSALQTAQQMIASNMPFVQQSFAEANEKTVVAAKAEVDAFITGYTMRTGLKQMEKMRELPVGNSGNPQ